MRGTHLRPGHKVHLIGADDFHMSEVGALPDPCPLPDQDKKSQSLSKKDSLLFAPLSNVGAVSFDEDAVYIDIGRVNYTKKENLDRRAKENGGEDDINAGGEDSGDSSDEESWRQYDSNTPAGLLRNLQDLGAGVDEKMERSSLRLFKGSKAVVAGSDDDTESDDANGDDGDDKTSEPTNTGDESPLILRPNYGDDEDEESSDSDGGSEDDSSDLESDSGDDISHACDKENSMDEDPDSSNLGALWKTDLARRAAESYLDREASTVNLQEFIYGVPKNSPLVTEDENDDSDADESSDDEEFFKVKSKSPQIKSKPGAFTGGATTLTCSLGENDSSRIEEGDDFDVSVWLEDSDDCLLESLRNMFVTGKWDNAGGKGSDDEEFGDFEDLETGEKFGPNGEFNEDDSSDADGEDELPPAGMTDEEIRNFNAQKKAAKKKNFDATNQDNSSK